MHRTLILAALAVALAVPAAHAQQNTGTQEPGAAGTQTQTRTPNAAGRQDPAARDAQAPNAAGARAAGGQTAAIDDQLFAAAAASGGQAEVAISQLGAQRATNDELKKFSQHMIEEHTAANRELMSLAQQKQFAVPRTPDVRAQFCQQSLAGLSGEEFDRCYAKAQYLVHLDSVAMFEAEAERGQDPEVKAWAAKTLPKIKEHLATIKPIAMKYMENESGNNSR